MSGWKDPSAGLIPELAGDLVGEQIDDAEAKDMASGLVEKILEQEISFSDWHTAHC